MTVTSRNARTPLCRALGAVTLGAALLAAQAAWPQDRERCYGVALAGENDGMAGDDAAVGAVLDFQGDAWSWTPAGACLTLPLPAQADGTPRRGSLEPLRRDRP